MKPVFASMLFLSFVALADARSLSLVSQSDDPANLGGQSGKAPDMDASGSIVAFSSTSMELDDSLYQMVIGNLPASLGLWPTVRSQIYLRNLDDGAQTLISRDQSSSTLSADGDCTLPSVDANGRYVAFLSDATNLTGDPASPVDEVFRFDRQTGAMHRMSSTLFGINGRPDVANTGAVVYARTAGDAARGDTNFFRDIYLAVNTATTQYLSMSTIGIGGASNGASDDPRISADGRVVVFESQASNLVAADGNAATDVFARDLLTGTTTRLSDAPGVDQNGQSSFDPDISYDGRFVVFTSTATNLIAGAPWAGAPQQIYLKDRHTGAVVHVSKDLAALGLNTPSRARIAPGGDYVVFEARGVNAQRSLVRYERGTGTLMVMQAMSAGLSNGVAHVIGDDGRDLVFDNDVPLAGIIAVWHEVYHTRDEPGRLEFTATAQSAGEGAVLRVHVARSDGSDGAVSALAEVQRIGTDDAALAPYDFGAWSARAGYLLSWDDADTAIRTLAIPIADDLLVEGDERFRLRLVDPEGGADIGAAESVVVTIIDND
jgi:Tol biopolymer transport system component